MKTFKPAWWLPNGHFQTIWASKVPRRAQVEYVYEAFTLSDGDETFVATLPTILPSTASNLASTATPIVVILHGLEGSAASNYAIGLMNLVAELNWQGAVLHFRGCHNGPNKYKRSYHSGDTKDLHEFLTHLKTIMPNAPIYVVGYSLGGNVLLKYLGEQGAKSIISSAVAVSVPFELNRASDRLTQGFSKLYQHVLLSSLKEKFFEKFSSRPPPVDKNNVEVIKTIREYDDVVTAPLHGFIDANDYYAKSSCRQYLTRISVKTLILHARDDPLVPDTAIPLHDELSETTTLECHAKGGHVAFVSSKSPFNSSTWLDDRIIDFLLQK
jgi:uncharacterized protein